MKKGNGIIPKLKYLNVSLFQVFLWQTVLLGWHDMMTDWMVILLAIVQFSRKSFKSSFESNLLQNNTVWGFFSSDCPWVGSWKMFTDSELLLKFEHFHVKRNIFADLAWEPIKCQIKSNWTKLLFIFKTSCKKEPPH